MLFFQIIMVGSGGVGKSALTLQFMYDEVRIFCFLFRCCFSLVLVSSTLTLHSFLVMIFALSKYFFCPAES